MIHVLKELGKGQPKKFPVAPIKEKTKLLVMDVSASRIHIEDMNLDKARRYAWVGHRKGNAPQDRLIVQDNIHYLIFEAPFLLLQKPEITEDPSLKSLSQRLENLIQTLGTLNLPIGKSLSMLRVDRLLNPSERQAFAEELRNLIEASGQVSDAPDVETLLRHLASLSSSEKNFKENVSKAFLSVLKKHRISSKDSLLCTFKDERGILVEDPTYHTYVSRTFQPSIENAQQGTCYGCGRTDAITPKTSAFQFFKFFNTDKPGFAPRTNAKRFPQAFGLCRTCYTEVLYGDRFALEHLRSSLVGMEVMILPYPVPDNRDIKDMADVLRKRLAASDTVEQWHEFQKALEDHVDFQSTWEDLRQHVFITFVFYETSNSAVKVLRIIQDIPPSRLDEMDEIRRQASQWARKYFREVGRKKSMWDLDLRTQYTLLPPTRDARLPALFLDYLEALLLKRPFPRETLLRHVLSVARAHAYKSPSFRGIPQNRTVEQLMVQTLVLDWYARNLGVLPPLPTGGGSMVLDRVPEHLRTYVLQHVPEGKARGLFLLGYVIGLIGEAQQKNVPRSEAKSPPILNGISYTGMDEGKVRRLANHVADRMRHYLRRWNYDEGERVLAAALQLFEESHQPLPPYEHTYWVLAGYGFARLGLRSTKEEITGGEEA